MGVLSVFIDGYIVGFCWGIFVVLGVFFGLGFFECVDVCSGWSKVTGIFWLKFFYIIVYR